MLKLSGLFAISRGGVDGNEVKLIDVLRAVHLVEVTLSDLGRMQDEVGANSMERNIKKVRDMLDQNRTRSVPQEHVARELKLTARELQDLRLTLAVRGLITIDKDDATNDIYWRKT